MMLYTINKYSFSVTKTGFHWGLSQLDNHSPILHESVHRFRVIETVTRKVNEAKEKKETFVQDLSHMSAFLDWSSTSSVVYQIHDSD